MQKEEPKKTSIGELKRENQKLRERIQEYKSLKEEFMATLVFEKAKRRLISWLTIGGILLTIAGIVGFKTILDYGKKLVTEKVESISEQQINKIIQEEGKTIIEEEANRQITLIVEQEREKLVASAEQQINRITVATGPIRRAEKPAIFAEPTQRQLDLSSLMTPVRNQGSEASTVGFAVAAALEYQIYKELGKQVIVSPRHLYYYAKEAGGFNPHADTGAHIRDAIKVLTTRGGVSEDVWPYKARDFRSRPTNAVTEHYQILESFQLTSLAEIKSALQQYGSVVGGIPLYDKSIKATARGVIPDYTPGESLTGSMAMCIVGYDDDKKLLKFKNSWGEKWGLNGYGFISYTYAKTLLDVWTFSGITIKNLQAAQKVWQNTSTTSSKP